jgi:WD40 repeat protein
VELIHGHDVPLFVIADTKGAMTLTGVSGKPFWHRENPPPGEGDSAVITAIATLPGEQEEDSQLVTADEDGKLRRWNLRDGLPSGPPISIGAGADAVRSICICDDPHGRLIAGMTDGNQILVWRVDDGELLWTLGERTDENWLGQYPRVFSIPGERNPSLVGAFTVDETLTLWNLGTGDVHCEVERDGYWLNTAHAFKGPSGRTTKSSTSARPATGCSSASPTA